jgi:CheY-like chemotaxis protein
MNQQRRVLVVDDDRDLLLGMRVRLSAAGYDVVTAEDGPKALHTAHELKPAAILMDNYMPGMDGVDVLEQLHGDPETQSIPVIMLSASVRDQQKALQRGARYFLQKPCESATVVAALSDVVGEDGRQ